jgi:two-component system sensor histidine kinase AtoS
MKPLIIPRLQQSRQNIGNAELNFLLDSNPQAAILIDARTQMIIASNTKAVELTAYTQKEMVNLSWVEVFSCLELNELMAMRNASIETTLTAHETHQIPVVVFPFIFDNNQWILLTIESLVKRQQDRAERIRSESQQNLFKQLIFAMKDQDPNNALDEILEIGGSLTGADALVIYIGDEQQLRLKKITSWGTGDIFPYEIPSADLVHLLEVKLWLSNKRIIPTTIHNIIKETNQTYMASAPIGETGAWIGFVAATGNKGIVPKRIKASLQILAAVIDNVIQTNLLNTYLRQSNRDFLNNHAAAEAIKEASQDGIVILSPDLRVSEINPVAEMLLGYTLQEVQSQLVENVLIGTNRLIPAIKDSLQGIPSHNLGDIYLHRRDGTTFPAHVKVFPIQHESQVVGVLLLIRDESKNKEIKALTQQLEQRAFLGDIMAVFSHEVKNPINNLSTGLQLLQLNLPKTNKYQEKIGRLLQDCARLTHLMESVLTSSRMQPDQFSATSIQDVIQPLLIRWRPRMKRVGVDHTMHIELETPQVLGNHRALERVFTNLISNAIKAMEDAGGTLAIKAKPIYAPSGRQMVQIDISDTGPGIPDDVKDKIFDPFFTTDKTSGTGLGLSITKQIITAHKGRINLTTYPGVTVFHVILPAHVDENGG